MQDADCDPSRGRHSTSTSHCVESKLLWLLITLPLRQNDINVRIQMYPFSPFTTSFLLLSVMLHILRSHVTEGTEYILIGVAPLLSYKPRLIQMLNLYMNEDHSIASSQL